MGFSPISICRDEQHQYMDEYNKAARARLGRPLFIPLDATHPTAQLYSYFTPLEKAVPIKKYSTEN
jgi:hypothetical protein